MKSRSGEFLYLSTDFEPPNKQGTQPLTEFLLSFVESLGGGEVGIQAHAECRLSIVRICRKNKKSLDFSMDLLEHSGFEPLTSTMRM